MNMVDLRVFGVIKYSMLALHDSKTCNAFFTFLNKNSQVNLEQSVLTNSDLTDAAVESSSRDIVAATAGFTVYDRRRHLI